FQVFTFRLGPRGDEKYDPVGGKEGIEDTMATALALPRGRVGAANLPGTAFSRYDRRSSRVARDLILQRPKFVVAQLQVLPVSRERSDLDEVIELYWYTGLRIGCPIRLLFGHRRYALESFRLTCCGVYPNAQSYALQDLPTIEFVEKSAGKPS